MRKPEPFAKVKVGPGQPAPRRFKTLVDGSELVALYNESNTMWDIYLDGYRIGYVKHRMEWLALLQLGARFNHRVIGKFVRWQDAVNHVITTFLAHRANWSASKAHLFFSKAVKLEDVEQEQVPRRR
jgi:hypothetical protein